MIPGTPTLPSWTPRRVALATLVALAVALAFYVLLRFYIVIFILFVAIVLAVAIRPMVDWLYRRGISRALGVGLVYLLLLALTAGFIWLLIPLLVDQVTTIAARIPSYYESLVNRMWISQSGLIQRLVMQLPGELAVSPSMVEGSGTGLDALAQVLSYASAAAGAIFVGVAISVLAFYWVLDGPRTVRSLLLYVPVAQRETVQAVVEDIENKVGAYMRGVVILSASVAVMAGAAYLIIGLPYALVLGLIAGVLEVLPVIGPVIGAVPPVLLVLSLEPAKVVWVILAVILIQQIEGNLLVPRVMDRAVGVNAIVTILSIAAFGSLFGIGGAIMAIPLAAVIQVLLDRFVFEPAAVPLEVPEGRGRYSALRYEAQQLVQDVRKQVRHKADAAEIEADQLEDLVEAIATDVDSALAQMELPQGAL